MSKINRWLRSKEKLFLVVLCGALMASFGLGGALFSLLDRRGPGGGRVFGEDVPGERINNLRRGLMALARNAAMKPQEQWALAWQALILAEEAERVGLVVTDVEVAQVIEANFRLEGGEFDQAAYQEFLTRAGIDRGTYENAWHIVMLAERLRAYVLESVIVPPEEAWLWYVQEEKEVKARYAQLPVDRLQPLVTLDEDEARKFYEENRLKRKGAGEFGAGYLRPERVRIEYLIARYTDMAEGIEISEDRILEYYEANKDTLYQVPVEQPEVPPAGPEAGDSGPLDADSDNETDTAGETQPDGEEGVEDVTPPEAPAAQAPGEERADQPAEPGLRYESLAEVHDEIEGRLRKEEAQKHAEAVMKEVNRAVWKRIDESRSDTSDAAISLVTLGEAFKEAGVTLITTDYFTAEKANEILPGSPGFIERAFGRRSVSAYYVSPVLESTAGKFVFRLLDMQPATPEPYEEVAERVMADLRLKKASELARRIAAKAVRAENIDAAEQAVRTALETHLAEAGERVEEKDPAAYYEAGETDFFKRPTAMQPWLASGSDSGANLPGDYDTREFVEAAFNLKLGEMITAADAQDAKAVYVLQTSASRTPGREQFEGDRQRVTRRFRSLKQQEAYAAWLSDLRRRAAPSPEVMRYLALLPGWGG